MNKKSYFRFFILALALVLGFGAVNTASAVPGENGEGYTLAPGQTNLIGADFADNSVAVNRDADSNARAFTPDTYGLRGTSQE